MKKIIKYWNKYWIVIASFLLIVLSVILYFAHFLMFRDTHHIFIYFFGDLAFVPIEVLLVTLIIHRLLGFREKKNMLSKLNMVIGTFFTEAGTDLLFLLSKMDKESGRVHSLLNVKSQWTPKEFNGASKEIKKYKLEIKSKNDDLVKLKEYIVQKRDFFLTLLENPNLLEHEDFTNLLWAVFHLTEELMARNDLQNLITSDRDHLDGDVQRAYVLLVQEWLNYMSHLSKNYPYLFSLALRTSPFNPEAKVTVK